MGTRLFIGHLARGTSQEELETFLRGYGEIREIAIIERYGFVEFRNAKDAAEALQELHGRNFRGERIIIEYARSRNGPRERRETRRPGPTRSGHRLVVENVSSRANWQDLKDHMRRAGEVCFADVHKERFGEGVVEFERYDDLKYALEKLQDSDFCGKRIHLVEDSRSQGHRSSRRGRSRSRSPRRGRSYSRSPRRSRGRSSRRSPSPRRSSRRSPSPRRSVSPRRSGSPRRSPSPRRAASPSRSPRRASSPRRDASHSRSPKIQSRTRRSNSRSRSKSPRSQYSRGSSRSRHADSPRHNGKDTISHDYDSKNESKRSASPLAASPRSDGKASPYADPDPSMDMDQSHDNVASDEI